MLFRSLLAKLGPPEIRLTGNPNQKLPEKIPVFVPVSAGVIYKWKGVEWTGNSLLSTTTLMGDFGMKAGDVADGMAIEAALEKIREEYAFLYDVLVNPFANFVLTARCPVRDKQEERPARCPGEDGSRLHGRRSPFGYDACNQTSTRLAIDR